jgi:hypothetical protein
LLVDGKAGNVMATVDQIREKDPHEVLRSIGLTASESHELFKRIEESRTHLLVVGLKKSSSKLKRLTVLVWAYTLIVWVYVIAMQLRYPESPYWIFAQWVPVRMDYIGEAAFLLSFILGIFVTSWTVRQVRDNKRLQELIK